MQTKSVIMRSMEWLPWLVVGLVWGLAAVSCSQPEAEGREGGAGSGATGDGTAEVMGAAPTHGRAGEGDDGAIFATGPSDAGSKARAGGGGEGGGWAVTLGTFSVGDHGASANAFRDEFVKQTGMTGAWVDSNEKRSIVRYGRYASPDLPEAKADLKRIQEIAIGDRHPFRMTLPAPIDRGTIIGSMPQYNLLNLRKMHPEVDEMFTLQIGAYGEERGFSAADARRAAEQAVTALRAEGETAFYYHGPRMSMVTLEVFFADAVDASTGVDSIAVRTLQKRYPTNSFNGRVLMEKRRLPNGEVREGPQSSRLVRVPEE